jgi:hypothetical protein
MQAADGICRFQNMRAVKSDGQVNGKGGAQDSSNGLYLQV